jgi:hypothetical protein
MAYTRQVSQFKAAYNKVDLLQFTSWDQGQQLLNQVLTSDIRNQSANVREFC